MFNSSNINTRGTKRLNQSNDSSNNNDATFRSKKLFAASPFEVLREEQSRGAERTPLDAQRAESSRQHVRALNTQFASWVQSQLQSCPDELWEDGVQDYLSHASRIMDKFNDIVEWLKTNAAKAESTHSFGTSHENKLVPEPKKSLPVYQKPVSSQVIPSITAAKSETESSFVAQAPFGSNANVSKAETKPSFGTQSPFNSNLNVSKAENTQIFGAQTPFSLNVNISKPENMPAFGAQSPFGSNTDVSKAETTSTFGSQTPFGSNVNVSKAENTPTFGTQTAFYGSSDAKAENTPIFSAQTTFGTNDAKAENIPTLAAQTKFGSNANANANAAKPKSTPIFGSQSTFGSIANAAKAENTSTFGTQTTFGSAMKVAKAEHTNKFGAQPTFNKVVQEAKNNTSTFQLPEKSIFGNSGSSASPSLWGSGSMSNSPTQFSFGNQNSASTNSGSQDDPVVLSQKKDGLDDEDELEQPSSPSVKKTIEKGVVVVHEVKCKLYVKSCDPVEKEGWNNKGMGQLSIRCKEGVSKATKESKPTIVIRNDVGRIILNASIYQGIKVNLQKNSLISIFHTSGGDSSVNGEQDDSVVARTYLLKTRTVEEINKLASAIHEFAPAA